jgi:cytochrome c biogenesis protein CcmG/thiol:disulfide interchange protein DsbE
MRRLVYLVPVALFFALATYFAIALRPGHDPNELPSALIDKPVPAVDLASLSGGARFDIAALKGQVLVVNFFASWCVPCRIEHPILMRLAQDEHLPLYGIAYKDREDASKQILVQLGDPYRRIGVDADGRTGINFGVYGVPETYVIDKLGHIRKRFVGPLSPEAADRELLPLVRMLERS